MGRPRTKLCPEGHDKDALGRVESNGACAECVRLGIHQRRYRTTDKYRSTVLKRRYGITLEEYLAMWEDQQGQCAVCDEPIEEVPHVDHDHATGSARGLVHPRCNQVVAGIEDPVYPLALQYLKRFSLTC